MKKTKYILTITLGLFIVGCNEGGSDTAGESNLPINTSNQKQVLAALFDSIDNATPQLPLYQEASSSGSSQSPLLQAAPTTQKLLSAAADATQTCSDGGMVYVSEDNGESVISYENCQERNTTTNGKVAISYNEGTQEVTYTLTDYTFKNNDKEYMTSLTTYTLSSGHVAYSSTGKMTTNEETTEFNKYNYTLDIVDNQLNISVNGFVKTAYLGDWVNIKTTKALQMNDTCPVNGELEALGLNSKLKVLFKSDQSLDVYLNNTLSDHYSDCDKIPDSSAMQL